MGKDAAEVLAERLDVQTAVERRRGRGALSNASGRFERDTRVAFDDGWEGADVLPAFRTRVRQDAARTIIGREKKFELSFELVLSSDELADYCIDI